MAKRRCYFYGRRKNTRGLHERTGGLGYGQGTDLRLNQIRCHCSTPSTNSAASPLLRANDTISRFSLLSMSGMTFGF
jgi:hypothetical protein